MSYEKYKFKILWKLFHGRYWGPKHIAIRDVPKGLPKAEVGACLDVVYDLIRKGYILRKKRDRLYVNPEKAKEIREFLEEFQRK